MALPVSGIDAAADADDGYTEIIAARTKEERYNYVIVSCETHDAIVSLDAGTTEHIFVPAGLTPFLVPCEERQGAIHGKNAVAQSDYVNLVVTAGKTWR